ncbi:MAG: hypothetical protein BWY31_03221 [Lentisphaerae bacterium ADurb.Bin242]|nr:MAG: hypothetical protein BWY31_03221 [Lentisphaerae bacterium ADurb.Bin242]
MIGPLTKYHGNIPWKFLERITDFQLDKIEFEFIAIFIILPKGKKSVGLQITAFQCPAGMIRDKIIDFRSLFQRREVHLIVSARITQEIRKDNSIRSILHNSAKPSALRLFFQLFCRRDCYIYTTTNGGHIVYEHIVRRKLRMRIHMIWPARYWRWRHCTNDLLFRTILIVIVFYDEFDTIKVAFTFCLARRRQR